jgi:hypothetical protein
MNDSLASSSVRLPVTQAECTMFAYSASVSRTTPLFHAVPVCHNRENPDKISTAALVAKDRSVDTLVL